MSLGQDALPISTNLDARMMERINAMDPPPAKIMVAGDMATTLSPIPDRMPYPRSMELGTYQMKLW